MVRELVVQNWRVFEDNLAKNYIMVKLALVSLAQMYGGCSKSRWLAQMVVEVMIDVDSYGAPERVPATLELVLRRCKKCGWGPSDVQLPTVYFVP